jgi:hypothetical protein
MRLSPIIATLGAMLFAASPPSYGASPNEDPAALTGVDTPESMALDKEAEKLVADRAKVIAEIKQRADKKQPVSDLQQQASKLVQQVYEKAQAAADARARAAVDQRCIKPSAEAAGGTANSAASPFLCEAIRTASTTGENDPWTVCACARRYLLGLRKELDELRAGRETYLGKAVSDNGEPSKYPLTAQEVDNLFRMAETIETDPSFGAATYDAPDRTLEALSRRAQRRLAQDRVDALLRGESPKSRTLQDLLGTNGLNAPKHQAYAYVLRSLTLFWDLHRRGALLRTHVLQQAVDERRSAEYQASFSEQRKNDDGRNDLLTAIPNPPPDISYSAIEPKVQKIVEASHDMAVAIDRRYDAMEYPYDVSTAQAFRAIVAPIRETRLRLKTDAEAWNKFAAKDGAGGGGNSREDFAAFVEQQFVTPWDLTVVLPSWSGDWASDHYEELTKKLQPQLPELSNSGVLVQPVNNPEKQLTEAVASGAGSTEQP